MSTISWHYDTDSSQVLRILAHGFIAGIGGATINAIVVLLLSLPEILPHIGLRELLVFVLLFLIGGPVSLLYLWPVLTDPTQRPDISVLKWHDRPLPWTHRSIVIATVLGSFILAGLAIVHHPFVLLVGLAVLVICSPILVNILTSIGSIDGDQLVCNGNNVRLHQVTNFRTLQVGNAVFFWVSYARGTGILVPRLLTVPTQKANVVRAALERGEHQPSEDPLRNRLEQIILGISGVLFFAVAGLAHWFIDDPVLSLYFGGILGIIGVLFWFAALRGV